MDAAADRDAPVSRLERSSHTAFIDNNTLHVWGGFQVRKNDGVSLPEQVYPRQQIHKLFFFFFSFLNPPFYSQFID